MVSARLLAAGTPRRERLAALSLLGLLFDHADAGGRVRVALDDLVGEFDLPPARVEEALEALVRVGAVRRGPERLELVGRQPPLSGSLRLTAFLANVAVVLDDEHAEPVPAALGRSPVLLADATTDAPPESSRRQRRLRPRQPALAALALTGVVLLAALSAGDTPLGLRTVGSPPSTTTDAAASPPPGASGRSEPGPSTPQPSQTTPADGQPVAGQDQPSASDGAEAAAGSSVPGGTGRGSSDRRAVAPGTDRPTGAPLRGDPVPSASAPQDPSAAAPGPPTAGPGPPTASPGPTVRCPARVPEIVVDDVTVRPAGPDVVLGVPATSVTEVRGTLHNPTTRATAVIRSFEVVIRFGPDRVTMPGPPVTLRPGERRQFTLRASRPVGPAPDPTVQATRILDWGWQEADVDRSCPI